MIMFTTISVILSCSKMIGVQNGISLVPVYPNCPGIQTRAVAVVTYSNQYDVVYICIVVTC